ncbi:hypothetical protein H5410_042024 [Solanum commersonii]|uniref:Uncharacterized protein n=1 Tax=Solanum commersonii TaxID=4109 RepID=A0A9J5XXA6_SOLCO|nr:hypothetical protein H5410_042024 [Solanum commersonii]
MGSSSHRLLDFARFWATAVWISRLLLLDRVFLVYAKKKMLYRGRLVLLFVLYVGVGMLYCFGLMGFFGIKFRLGIGMGMWVAADIGSKAQVWS